MTDDAAVSRYHEQGWLAVEDVLDARELAMLRQTVQTMLEDARGLTAHTDLYDLEPSHTPDTPRVRRIKVPHRHNPTFMDTARHPRLLAILKRLLGTEPCGCMAPRST